MDPYTRQFEVPYPRMQQTGSFNAPVLPPLMGPFDGPLVTLPCINPDWLRLLLGAADQLRNPSTWAGLDDAGLDLVLNRVDELKGVLSLAPPCCDVSMRLTTDCILQFSTDGGATWTAVTDWVTNFDSCVKAHIPPQVPLLPPGTSHDQHACNMAGYLAQELMERLFVAICNHFTDNQGALLVAQDVMRQLGQVFPLTSGVFNAFNDVYNQAVSHVISQAENARDDPTLWSNATAAIYLAIRATGYVTAANFSTVAANLAAISYTDAWVPAALSGFWNDLGLANILALQQAGAIDVVDCSAIGVGWCFQWDFTVSDGGWTNYDSGYHSSWSAGSGWLSFPYTPSAQHIIGLHLVLPAYMNINHFAIDIVDTNARTPPNGSRQSIASAGVPTVQDTIWPDSAYPTVTTLTDTFSTVSCNNLTFYWAGDTLGGGAAVSRIAVGGDGVSPFGYSNCA